MTQVENKNGDAKIRDATLDLLQNHTKMSCCTSCLEASSNRDAVMT
jgi:hypothetical protein